MFINALKLYLVTLNLLGVKVEFKFLKVLKMILLLEKQNEKMNAPQQNTVYQWTVLLNIYLVVTI